MKCVHTIFNYMGCSIFSRRAVQRCFFINNKFVKSINQNKIADLELLQICRPNFQFPKIKNW